MRFSLTTALLGDGYYSYEISTDGHGTLGLMWFDEYDCGGIKNGYLGYPTSEAIKMESEIYMRDFENGLILVNPTEEKVIIDLSTLHKKSKKKYQTIKGIQVPKINTGEIVDILSLDAYDGIILIEHK